MVANINISYVVGGLTGILVGVPAVFGNGVSGKWFGRKVQYWY